MNMNSQRGSWFTRMTAMWTGITDRAVFWFNMASHNFFIFILIVAETALKCLEVSIIKSWYMRINLFCYFYKQRCWLIHLLGMVSFMVHLQRISCWDSFTAKFTIKTTRINMLWLNMNFNAMKKFCRIITIQTIELSIFTMADILLDQIVHFYNN